MLIIDRFEGDIVVVEADIGEHLNISREKIPKNAKEGDCLVIVNGVYEVDEAGTKKLREDTIKLQNSLWE